MRLTICLTAAVALCACSKQAEAPPAADNGAAEMNAPAAATMVTANGSTPGTYEVTMKDGTKSKATLMADGTYADTDPKGKETKGTWNVTGGKTCFDPDGAEGPMCYTESAVGADGSFTATPDKGDPVTVKKVS
ncbi:MAG TPA: hypothetical protein VFY95_04520 [Sphingomicrobium sp.]